MPSVEVAGHRPGRVADQRVDFARLQRREARLRGERHEAHLGRVVEDRGGDGAAVVDVEPGPVALRVGNAEAGEPGPTPQLSMPRWRTCSSWVRCCASADVARPAAAKAAANDRMRMFMCGFPRNKSHAPSLAPAAWTR